MFSNFQNHINFTRKELCRRQQISTSFSESYFSAGASSFQIFRIRFTGKVQAPTDFNGAVFSGSDLRVKNYTDALTPEVNFSKKHIATSAKLLSKFGSCTGDVLRTRGLTRPPLDVWCMYVCIKEHLDWKGCRGIEIPAFGRGLPWPSAFKN